MDLNGVLMFVRVVQLGSFSKAAIDLGIPKSTVSKKVADLERNLRTTLLRRTTRSLILTEMGRVYFEEVSRSLAQLKLAEINAQATSQEPAGHLRVTAVADFATQVLAPVFADFLDNYPKVTLELVLTDKVLNLVNDNIDVAIRIGKMADSSLRYRKLGSHRYKLVASPDYLKLNSDVKSPNDLPNHKCLVFAPNIDFLTWNLKSGGSTVKVDVKGQFIANSASAVKALAVNGAGVTLLPISVCADELATEKLKIVLPDWGLEDAPVYFIYQGYAITPPKVLAFMDFVGEKIKPLL